MFSSIYIPHCSQQDAEISTLDKIHARKATLYSILRCMVKSWLNTTH